MNIFKNATKGDWVRTAASVLIYVGLRVGGLSILEAAGVSIAVVIGYAIAAIWYEERKEDKQ